MRGLLLALSLACSGAWACSNAPQTNQAVQDAAKAQAELKRQLGVTPSIRYAYTAADDGGQKRLDVEVRYSQKPDGDLSAAKEKIDAIVKQSFHDPVSSVTVRF